MLTAGVDLAAESKGTALAVLDWRASHATLVELHLGVDDPRIAGRAAGVDKLGIDCALGWPDEFVSFVAAHASGEVGARVDGGMDWRRTLAYRETDREVRRQTGRWPLSVSTDRLGLTAMRCAGLLARISEAGVDVDRTGLGIVVEVYPGASLRLWGFATTGYRTEADRRAVLLQSIRESAPWLDIGEFAELMVASADAFDAVVAALAARNAAVGAYSPPAPALRERAGREGWIALPNGRLSDLVNDSL
jgi:predicted nuclease with RNAse H fold